jgi:threonine/homoserine/homoserine lactone efflux protein
MITALFLGMLLGFSLSIPPGPLALAFMKKAVSRDYAAAFLVAFGAAVMDILYNVIAASASSALVVWLSDLFVENKWLSVAFQAICFIVLIVLGVRYLLDKHDAKAERHIVEREREQEERVRTIGHGSPFFLGTLIAFTNLATPTFLPSMIAAISYLHAEGFLARSLSTNVLYAVGFGVGTIIWFSVILRFIMKHHAKLSSAFITTIYKIAGAALVLFALALAYHVAFDTEWSAVLGN